MKRTEVLSCISALFVRRLRRGPVLGIWLFELTLTQLAAHVVRRESNIPELPSSRAGLLWTATQSIPLLELLDLREAMLSVEKYRKKQKGTVIARG
jgi:hypothetical protein